MTGGPDGSGRVPATPLTIRLRGGEVGVAGLSG